MVAREVVEMVASEAARRCFTNFLAFRGAEARDCTIWGREVRYLTCG